MIHLNGTASLNTGPTVKPILCSASESSGTFAFSAAENFNGTAGHTPFQSKSFDELESRNYGTYRTMAGVYNFTHAAAETPAVTRSPLPSKLRAPGTPKAGRMTKESLIMAPLTGELGESWTCFADQEQSIFKQVYNPFFIYLFNVPC